jgi:hypothetical protein
MGCWHGHGHGCGPGCYRPAARGCCGPVDEYDLYGWYEDVNLDRGLIHPAAGHGCRRLGA